MKRLLAAILVVGCLVTALVAHAATLSVDAGVLQTQQTNFVFTPPQSEDDCKQGGWEHYTDTAGNDFRNQGACISYVNGGGTLVPKAP